MVVDNDMSTRTSKRSHPSSTSDPQSCEKRLRDSRTVNVLVNTIYGMGLPATLCIAVTQDTPLHDLVQAVTSRVYASGASPQNIRLSTSTGRVLCVLNGTPYHNPATVASLLSSPQDDMLTLRLTIPLCGGKGGFGSQLRAAGGKMSSRKKKKPGDINGSNRNLDGRRLRTVNEAKALAEYLSIKPQMEAKEKERRRKRWQQIVEMTERKQEEIREGKVGSGRLDGKWVEAKEEAMEKTREAVIAAMSAGEIREVFGDVAMRESDESGEGSDAGSGSEDEAVAEGSSATARNVAEAAKDSATPRAVTAKATAPKSFFGWDEDEDVSDSEAEGEPIVPAVKDKGKAKA